MAASILSLRGDCRYVLLGDAGCRETSHLPHSSPSQVALPWQVALLWRVAQLSKLAEAHYFAAAAAEMIAPAQLPVAG